MKSFRNLINHVPVLDIIHDFAPEFHKSIPEIYLIEKNLHKGKYDAPVIAYMILTDKEPVSVDPCIFIESCKFSGVLEKILDNGLQNKYISRDYQDIRNYFDNYDKYKIMAYHSIDDIIEIVEELYFVSNCNYYVYNVDFESFEKEYEKDKKIDHSKKKIKSLNIIPQNSGSVYRCSDLMANIRHNLIEKNNIDRDIVNIMRKSGSPIF